MRRSRVVVAVDVVVFRIRAATLEVLLVRRQKEPFRDRWALPEEFVATDDSLERAARRVLEGAMGRADLYLEQLYTYGGPERDPRGRVVSVAYLAVVPGEAGGGSEGAFHPAQDPPALAFDHGEILASAVERLHTKTEYSTVPLRFLVEPFTLTEVQQVYEVLLDRPLDKRNFRRKMLALNALAETAGKRREGAHRPARLFRLSPDRPHLLKERGILFPF